MNTTRNMTARQHREYHKSITCGWDTSNSGVRCDWCGQFVLASARTLSKNSPLVFLGECVGCRNESFYVREYDLEIADRDGDISQQILVCPECGARMRIILINPIVIEGSFYENEYPSAGDNTRLHIFYSNDNDDAAGEDTDELKEVEDEEDEEEDEDEDEEEDE